MVRQISLWTLAQLFVILPVALCEAQDQKPVEKPTMVIALPAKPIAKSARKSGKKKVPAAAQKNAAQKIKATRIETLPSKYAMYTFGGGGRYLIFRFDDLGKAGIMDVDTGTIVHEISGISKGDLLAANDTHLFIVMPGKMLIQTWSLAKFERELMIRIEGDDTPRDAIIGAAGQGPLLLLGRKGRLFDPETLKPLVVSGDGVIGGIDRYGYSMCVSANGLVFGGIPVGYGAVAHAVMQVHGDRTVVRKLGGTSQAIRWAQPTADGHVVFTPSSGIHDAVARPLSAKWLDGRLLISTFDARYFLALRYIDDNSKVVLEVGTTADLRVIYTETGVEELLNKRASSWHEILSATKSGREPRVQWLPSRKLLVTLPSSNDRVIFRPWDVVSRVKKSGEEYLWIESLPPFEAYEGEKFRYQVRVVSRVGKVKCRLEEGPKGMTVSSNGKVQWNVPESFSSATAPVIITATDSAGNELIHSFQLNVGPKLIRAKTKTT